MQEHLDETLGLTQEIRFKKKHEKVEKKLAAKLRFSKPEIKHLCLIFYHMELMERTRGGRGIGRESIKYVKNNALDLTEKTIVEYSTGIFDKYLCPKIQLDSWLKMMSIILRGTFEQKIKYVYMV